MLIEQVNDDQAAVEITSEKSTAHLVSEDEYLSLRETVHLLRSLRNAERLRESLVEARSGGAQPRDLVEPGSTSSAEAWRSRAPHGWEDCCSWSADRKTLQEINRMIEESWRDAGQGVGTPERLCRDLAESWSRRITDEHRLVCEVVDGAVLVHQARHHC